MVSCIVVSDLVGVREMTPTSSVGMNERRCTLIIVVSSYMDPSLVSMALSEQLRNIHSNRT